MSRPIEDHRIDNEIHRTDNGSDPFSAAVRATRMPMLITDARRPDNPIVFVNDAFSRLTGYSREETLGRNCRFLQGPGTNTDDVARVRDAIEQLVPIEIDLLNYRKDGTTFWNRLLISPVFDEGELTYFFASQFDITPERERLSLLSQDRDALEAEIQSRVLDLAESEERLRFTLKAGGFGTWTLDLATERLVPSVICKENFGRSAADTFSYADLKACILPEDFDYWQAAVTAALGGDGALDIEYRILTPQGQLRWIEIRAQTRFDAQGQPLSMAGVSMDITARKESEAHRNLLIQELNHRVKNTLATVQAIVDQSLRSNRSIEQIKSTISHRLMALAGAHDVLAGDNWNRVRIHEVVSAAMKPFADGQNPRIHYNGDEAILSERSSTALSLALHELATNAVKYGALSCPEGQVSIDWRFQNDEFYLVWTETNGPRVEPPKRTGFGTRMIEQALASSLQGKAFIDYRPEGIVFRFQAGTASLLG
jgi:PAS domain S-box-containing protein